MQDLKAGELFLEPQVAAHADAMFVVLSDPALYEYENQAPLSVYGLRERFPDLPERPDAKTVFLKLRELRNDW